MRHAIRLLTAGALVLFAAAVLLTLDGEHAVATLPAYRWPGFAE